ncbi:MAG: glycoside hydrolase family 57 protein [Candidatus Acidiferrales bacterium]
MTPIHLVLLWHMHQPQYRSPSTGQYVMPWTRLHALKDYWGIVRMLEEFPGVHVTVNVAPSLAMQLEEYGSGQFDEPWFELALRPVAQLEAAGKYELLAQGFQLNRNTLLRRWPRYVELFTRVMDEGVEHAAQQFGPRDWRDLQLLSQLAWMDEEYLAHDPAVAALAHKGGNFTEEDKAALRNKQLELLARVLPEYRAAADRGQVELSTTPFYHPILPLLCDSDIARVANPHSPNVQPPFRHPEDAREQLRRARVYHQRVFGRAPAGLWPSEGSVSDCALDLAIETGFRWFATGEGVLGRTLGLGFPRDAAGIPANALRLYAPLAVRRAHGEICGLFRDHEMSDLVGFVYSRMEQRAAAEDLHVRLRRIGERVHSDKPLTVSIILDGENAWEYYPGNGRLFLREFYRRIQDDPDIHPLTASEAIHRAAHIETAGGIFPGSWINANFDIWIGHAEDVQAWHLLREARDFYAQAERKQASGAADAPAAMQLTEAYESLLAAEGSDWCWWYGPEHASAHAEQFDALYRQHLTAVYVALGAKPPESLAQPIKQPLARAVVTPPTSELEVHVDGRESTYFEWIGAGAYFVDRRSGAMHGGASVLQGFHYGFNEENFFLRVDVAPEFLAGLEKCEVVVSLKSNAELRITARLARGKLTGFAVALDKSESSDAATRVTVAFARFLEVRIAKDFLPAWPAASVRLGVALWRAGLPLDLLPSVGAVELPLTLETPA